MQHELKVPTVGESVHDVQIGLWRKQEGERAEKDESLVEIETEKATVEVPAPVAGVVTKILKKEGEMAVVGEVIGFLDDSAAPRPAAATAAQAPAPPPPTTQAAAVPGQAAAPTREPARVMPAAERVLEQQGLDAGQVAATGPGGRLLKEDVERHAQAAASAQASPAPTPPKAEPPKTAVQKPAASRAVTSQTFDATTRQEEIVPMTLIRRRIAERLIQAQQAAALLTTFNEIDMTATVALRQEHRDAFQERHGVKLGFMSLFVKAAVEALKRFPEVNAEIRGTDIVYRNYFDIGVAVGGGKGLVVPVLRNAERMSFADIERTINELAARDNKLKPEDLQGGTFTISNGGVYGSLLSTPIVNPPQSGILGLHAIQDRPVAREGQVVIRPMMYVALTYDHRIIDGREAVGFLRHIKDIIEQPSRMLLEI